MLREYLVTKPPPQPSGEKLHLNPDTTQFYLNTVNTSTERLQVIKTSNQGQLQMHKSPMQKHKQYEKIRRYDTSKTQDIHSNGHQWK
jgi:hypothetical protein